MRLAVETHRSRRLSLTPLVDVIFLLLMFFMLSSTFTRHGQVELTGGEAGASAVERPDIIMSIDANGISINGVLADLVDVPAQLNVLEAAGAQKALVVVQDNATSETLIALVETVRRQTRLALTVAR